MSLFNIKDLQLLRETTLQLLMMVTDADDQKIHAMGYKSKEDALIKIIDKHRKRHSQNFRRLV